MKMNSDQLVSAYETASSMNAIGLTQFPEIGKVADALEMLSVPAPRPTAEQVAIRLCASSMHIDEIFSAQGTALGRFYGPKVASPEKPHILGSSVSDVVVGLGENSDNFLLGDEVIVIPDHQMEVGSWADYRCVDQKMVMSKLQLLRWPPALLGVQLDLAKHNLAIIIWLSAHPDQSA